MNAKPLRLMRLAEVRARVGISRTTVYRWIQVGKFPKPVKLGILDAWLESEIETWIEQRIFDRDTAQKRMQS